MAINSRIAFVTGISGGIGHALVHELLTNGFIVFGIGRNNTIQEKNFQFISLDLRKTDSIAHFNFPQIQAEHYLLVNNAGILGEILPVGELGADGIAEVMQVNATSPQILINTFIQTFSRQNVPLHVLNISSGAARNPVDAWAPYCASKAALEMFSEAVKIEIQLRGQKNFFIHSVAPGVVDTNMQIKIREASPEKFKTSQRFHDLKNNGELIATKSVAEKLMTVIAAPQDYQICKMALSDI